MERKMITFKRPEQVMFWDDAKEDMSAGIAYCDIIICACCGGVYNIQDVIEDAPAEVEEPVKMLPWIDFSEEIKECT